MAAYDFQEKYETALPIGPEEGPRIGLGARAMNCRFYDECLYEAAKKNWDSFHCEHCQYQFKGLLEPIEPAVINDLEEDPLVKRMERIWGGLDFNSIHTDFYKKSVS